MVRSFAAVGASDEDELTAPFSMEEQESSAAEGIARCRAHAHKAAPLGVGAALLLLGAVALTSTSRAPAPAVTAISESMVAHRHGDSDQGLVQLFGDMAHSRHGPDGRPAQQREEIRKLIDRAPEWEAQPKAAVQCTVDVVKAVTYLGQVVVFMYKAAESCPDSASCGVSVSIVLASFAWIASYLSLAAESCKVALQAHSMSEGAICSSDVSGLVADLLEIIGSAQAVVVDCDSGRHHNSSAVADLWRSIKRDDRSIGRVLTQEYEKLGLLKTGAPRKWDEFVGPLRPPDALRPDASPAMGRRLRKKPVGAMSDFLAAAKAARAEKLKHEQQQMARNYDIAQCVFDVTQSVTYIARATFQIHSALEHCPDPTACSVDILKVFSSFAWIGFYTAWAVDDCAVQPNSRGYCAGDILDMVGAVANGASLGLAFGTDCAPE